MRAKITVIFDQDGNSKIEVTGVKGKSCTDLTKFLEDGLGEGTRETKPEYLQTEAQRLDLRLRQ
ncbi:MAG: DUF2997 domain-containing protein [Planctomycetes bacterium]|nr:DUF2997 domain-containing protein [Planctomycetota bacterium]